jgi:hypothetical protein
LRWSSRYAFLRKGRKRIVPAGVSGRPTGGAINNGAMDRLSEEIDRPCRFGLRILVAFSDDAGPAATPREAQ